MDSNTAGGLINQLLYDIDQVRDLNDDTMIARCAESIIQQRHFRRPAAEYAEAIDTVLRDGHLSVQTLSSSRLYAEPALLSWLSRLAIRLRGRDEVDRVERSVSP